MKNKPLDRGSRRLRYVSKLHAQLRRPLWWKTSVCGVVEVWASKGWHNPRNEFMINNLANTKTVSCVLEQVTYIMRSCFK